MLKHSLPVALGNLSALNVTEDVGVEDWDRSHVLALSGVLIRLVLTILSAGRSESEP